MERRTFLKITGMGTVGFAAGCSSDPERNLYTLVQAPEDMVTGKSAWYATTCRECPAGCGVLAKNREGRAIKLEGNPLHPVNKGKLCARGQAALQELYDPDRLRNAVQQIGGRGTRLFEPLQWDRALPMLLNGIVETRRKKKLKSGDEVTFNGQTIIVAFE